MKQKEQMVETVLNNLEQMRGSCAAHLSGAINAAIFLITQLAEENRALRNELVKRGNR